jgi:multidrug resistance efflux pump
MNTQIEKEIVKEEKELVAEVKKEEKLIAKLIKDVRALIVIGLVLVVGVAGGIWYFVAASHEVKIENSQVTADAINLAPAVGGRLNAVYVHEGDMIDANTVVALSGNELIKTKIGGLVIMAREDIGKSIAPGETVVSMIDPGDLRVVGRLAEDKGLNKVSVGDAATFTVDAFGSRKFNGIVDEVSPTSRSSDVVFSISDKRQENEFNVKVRYDISAYPDLKNGMSAKLTIYHN